MKSRISFAVAVAVSFAAGAPVFAEEELEALDIQLPKMYFSSTPLHYSSDNFAGPIYEVEPFMAPKGAVNLSQGKPVTSSDPDPNYGKLELVTDGKIGHEEEYVVELEYGPQWVQIDLGQVSELYAIALWHFYTNDRVYFDVVVRTADDAEFTENVQTIYNADYDNSLETGEGKDPEYIDTFQGWIIDAKRAKGQFVRLYSNGNTTDECNHYIEVQVFGKPAK